MDTWLDLNTINLLGRVDSRINKETLVKAIIKDYKLGSLIKFRQIHEGFEDYNIRLLTTKGIYLLKLFSQFKSFRHVKDNIQGLIEFSNAGIRVPKLYKSVKGEYLYYYETKDTMALGCVMEYFKGKSFLKLEKEPTIEEMRDIVKDIVKINTVSFRPLGIYDVWVVQNLVPEFEKKRMFLSQKDFQFMKPVIKDIKKINYSKCIKGTIHGDLQRSNVLRNNQGEMRIIDFSVMEYNAVAIELATYLSLFCINPQKTGELKAILIYKEIIAEYIKYKKLCPYDIKIIPDLMLGTYAANCLAASYELRGKGNDTEETHYWINLGSFGMKLMWRIINRLKKIQF
jgi:Ser/Thr protein kinase RdoA (MazF antagonist)